MGHRFLLDRESNTTITTISTTYLLNIDCKNFHKYKKLYFWCSLRLRHKLNYF